MLPESHDTTETRTQLLERIIGRFDGTWYGAENWRSHTGGWTTPECPTPYGEFQQRYPQLLQLSLDPGFVTHLPEFLAFVDENGLPDGDCWRVRTAFKDYLGHREAWRGMMLNDEEAVAVREKGICANLLRETDAYAQAEGLCSTDPLAWYPQCVVAQRFSVIIEQHFHRDNKYTPLISITSHEDLAIAAGHVYGRNSGERRLHVYRLRVPEIDIIHYTTHGARAPYMIARKYGAGLPSVQVIVDDRKQSYPWDRDLESYILLQCDQTEIVDITTPQPRTVSLLAGRA